MSVLKAPVPKTHKQEASPVMTPAGPLESIRAMFPINRLFREGKINTCQADILQMQMYIVQILLVTAPSPLKNGHTAKLHFVKTDIGLPVSMCTQ